LYDASFFSPLSPSYSGSCIDAILDAAQPPFPPGSVTRSAATASADVKSVPHAETAEFHSKVLENFPGIESAAAPSADVETARHVEITHSHAKVLDIFPGFEFKGLEPAVLGLVRQIDERGWLVAPTPAQ